MTPISIGPITTNTTTVIGKVNGVTTTLFIGGTWGSHALEIYASPDGITYYPTGMVFTSDICRPLNLNPEIYIAAVTTGTGDLSLTIKRV